MIRKSFINVNEDIFVGENDDSPLFDRANPLVNAVACHKIPDLTILDQKKNLLDLNVVREHMKNEGRLNNQQVVKLYNDALDVLAKESNVLCITRPTHVIGDTHGQYYDLLSFIDKLLKKALEQDHCILFVGDYVDRGLFSCEIFLFLLLLKSHYPNNVYLTRGNHESHKMTTYFTFYAECIHKYNGEVYRLFLDLFNALPLAAVIQNGAFCCHGGIGPTLTKISAINKINRFVEVPYDGTFCDLLWADPHPNYDKPGTGQFEPNDQRRTSYYYSHKDVRRFLDSNGLKVIIRGHEVQDDGYKLYGNATGQLEVVTVFSAPNYCDAYKNMGAIVFYDQGVQEISQFTAVRHPYVLSGFQDGITWSFPFLAEKVLQFTLDLLNHGSSLKSCSSTQSSNNEEITDIFASIIGDTTDLLQKEDDLMKKVVLMRTERECIDEFADEESAVDCCNLEAKEMDDLNFGEAKDQDRVNEEAVSTPKLQSQQLTLNLSPSLANSAINGVVKGNEDVVIKKSEGIEEIVNYKIADDQNGLIDQNRQNESNKQTSTIKQNKRKRSPWYCFWCAY